MRRRRPCNRCTPGGRTIALWGRFATMGSLVASSSASFASVDAMTKQDAHLRVLGRNTSSNVQKVLWCLAELGKPYQREDYGGPFGGTSELHYLRLNPNGKVPTLIDGDVAIWESNTIVRYLCNKFGPTLLYPGDFLERALAERWMDWQLATLAEALLPMYRALVREHANPADVEPARERTARLLEILDGALTGRRYLNGAELTVADIAVGPLVYRWYELRIRREDTPNLLAYYERLARRPAFRENVMIGLH
jgi:glutathione S-transferase